MKKKKIRAVDFFITLALHRGKFAIAAINDAKK